MDTLFVHRSVLARTYKFSIIPIEHPFNDFSILLVLVDGDASSQNLCIPCPPPCICCIGPGAILSYQCILISLQLDKNWRWLFMWQQLVTNTNDPFIHDINSVSSLQRSCIGGLNLVLKLNKIGHTFLSFMAQKTIQYDLGNCNDSNFESSSAVGLWLGRQ